VTARKKPDHKSYWSSVFNAGTLVNLLFIPALTVLAIAVGFYFSSKEKFVTYDQAAADVVAIKMHNAAQDEQVKQITVMLDKISNQVFDLQRVQPLSGPGSGGGSAVGGGVRGH
jgi:hypothetical protein